MAGGRCGAGGGGGTQESGAELGTEVTEAELWRGGSLGTQRAGQVAPCRPRRMHGRPSLRPRTHVSAPAATFLLPAPLLLLGAESAVSQPRTSIQRHAHVRAHASKQRRGRPLAVLRPRRAVSLNVRSDGESWRRVGACGSSCSAPLGYTLRVKPVSAGLRRNPFGVSTLFSGLKVVV